MAIQQTNAAGTACAPAMEPIHTSTGAPKKPQDNTAATQAPKETKQAVQNSFGDMPKGGHARQPASPPKVVPVRAARGAKSTSATGPKNAPAEDPKFAQAATTGPLPPLDPEVQAIMDTRFSGKKTVKEQIDADAPAYIFKAAQDHYNKQKENGETLDAISKYYLHASASSVVKNGFRNAGIPPEDAARIFNKDAIDSNVKEILNDPTLQAWMQEQQANAIEHIVTTNPAIARLVAPHMQLGENHVNALRRMQSEYMTSQEFADAVANAPPQEGKQLMADAYKGLAGLGLGAKEILGVNNALVENIRATYTPDAPKDVINPDTNQPVKDADGNAIATLPDGTAIARDSNGRTVTDRQGNAWVYNTDGTPRLDANNQYVQYDAKARSTYVNNGGTKHVVDASGNGMRDAAGNRITIDNEGGAPVAVGADGKVVTDTAGNEAVVDMNTGKQLVDPDTGNKVVIDKESNAVVQLDADGKVVAAANGDPYAVDQATGKFVTDKDGRYVLVSKENIAPGIVPGYVIDRNNTRVVVDPYYNGKPMVDPRTGMTVIFDPKTNAPELVLLDADGAPKQAEDGSGILIRNGHTVVANTGTGPDWLVDKNGKYATDGKGNFIGVDQKSGLAAAVDAKGAPVRDAGGHIPLWDPKTEGPMMTGDRAANIVVDWNGNLLAANAAGETLIDPGTSMPYLIDPKTHGARIDPDSGQPILLDTGANLPFEYNGMDGYKYLADPKTNKAVRTESGAPVVLHDTSRAPYAVNADGTPVRNPETGNVVVYGFDGKALIETIEGKDYQVEITANGKAYLIAPETGMPVAAPDRTTGGYQLYNKDGTDTLNPATGNKVQLDPASGLRMEIDGLTGKVVEDGFGNKLVLGPDNNRLKTPDGDNVVFDKNTRLPVAAGADGKIEVDPDSGLPRVINATTGAALEDPVTKVSVVADPKSGAPVQVSPETGEVIKEASTGLPIIASIRTGEQLKSPTGEPVVMAPVGLPVYLDKQTNTLTVADPLTGKPLENPKTGAKTIIEPHSGIPLHVKPDANGNLVVVDRNGDPVMSPEKAPFHVDPATGQITYRNAAGEYVNAYDGKKPEPFDPGTMLPRTAFGMARAAGADPATVPGIPLEGSSVPVILPVEVPPEYFPGARWKQPGFALTPEELADAVDEFKANHNNINFNRLMQATEQRKKEVLQDARRTRDPAKIKAAEAYQNIPTEELAIIEWYTVNSDINRVLAGGDLNEIARYTGEIEMLSSGLNHLREAGYGYEGTVYRYIELETETIKAQHPVHRLTRMPRFTSTSSAENFGWHGNVKLKLQNVTGTDISMISPVTGEVLLEPDRLYYNDSAEAWTTPHRQNAKLDPDVYAPIEVTATNRPYDPVPAYGAPGSSSAADPMVDEITPAKPETPIDEVAAKAPEVRWPKLMKALSHAGDVIDMGMGVVQVVFGGLTLSEAIKQNDPYGIASGSFNVASGALSIAGGAAGIAGGALAAAAIPLAVAGIFAGGIASIIEYAGTLDDDEQFADELLKTYGPLGILNADAWNEAVAAYRRAEAKYYPENYLA